MTEAGKKWVEMVSFFAEHHYKDAEFWIRAFCEEVERRNEDKGFYDDFDDVYWKFKRELLGE